MRNTVVTPMFRYSFCCLRHGEVTFKQMLQFQNWEGRMNDKPVTHEVKTSSRQPESDAVLGHSWVARGLLQCPSLRIKHTLHCCSYTNPSFLPLPGRRKALPLWRGVVSRSMPGGLQLIWLWKPSRHTDRAEEGQAESQARASPKHWAIQTADSALPGSWAAQDGAKAAFLPGKEKENITKQKILVFLDPNSKDSRDLALPSSVVVLQQHACTSAADQCLAPLCEGGGRSSVQPRGKVLLVNTRPWCISNTIYSIEVWWNKGCFCPRHTLTKRFKTSLDLKVKNENWLNGLMK